MSSERIRVYVIEPADSNPDLPYYQEMPDGRNYWGRRGLEHILRLADDIEWVGSADSVDVSAIEQLQPHIVVTEWKWDWREPPSTFEVSAAVSRTKAAPKVIVVHAPGILRRVRVEEALQAGVYDTITRLDEARVHQTIRSVHASRTPPLGEWLNEAPPHIRVLLAQEKDRYADPRWSIRTALEKLAPEIEVVAFAESGAAVLREAEAHKPDLILSGWSFEDTNIPMIAARLLKTQPTIPVIAMTVSLNPDMIKSAMANGVDNFFSLPPDVDELYNNLVGTYRRRKTNTQARIDKYFGGIPPVHMLVMLACNEHRDDCAALHKVLMFAGVAIEVMRWAYEPNEALSDVRSLQPDAVLIDHRVTDDDALALAGRLAVEFPDVAVVLMGDEAEESMRGWRSVKGYLKRPFSADELIRVMRAARYG
jgi:DNA-binding NarL/FixJ family response regulator